MTVRTWAQALKIERTDGTVFAITELDRDITYDSVIYKANASYTPAVIDLTANLAVNNSEISGFLSAIGIPRADVQAGLFDHAKMTVLMLDYQSETLVKILQAGKLGESKIYDDAYEIEFRSLAQLLQQPIGRKFLKNAPPNTADPNNGIVVADWTETGTLTSATSNRIVTDTSRAEADDYFTYGNFTFTSGLNNGLSQEVKAFSSGQFTFFLPFPFDVNGDETYSVYAGFDGKLSTARDKFGSDAVINFQGFPDKPQRDKASKFGGQ